MEQYIKKSALVSEIEKLIDEIYAGRPFDSLSSEQQTALWYVKSIMSSINNLEVKEVDFGALGVLAEHLITCDAHLVTPKYTDKELDLLEEWAKNNKPQKIEKI